MEAAEQQQQSAATVEPAAAVVRQMPAMLSLYLMDTVICSQVSAMTTRVLQEMPELVELREHQPGRLIYRDAWHLMQPAAAVVSAVTVDQAAEDAPRQVAKTIWSAAAAAEAAEAAVLRLLQSVPVEPVVLAAVQAVS